jgi:hypothetical protein
MRKDASASFLLLIGGGEREGVVPVLHVGDGRPTPHRSGGTKVRHWVSCSVPLMIGPQSGFRRVA